MMKTRIGLLIAAAVALVGVTGCTTKNYVKTQTAPIVDHTNQLEEKTADNNRSLHDVDDRATAGIKQAQGAADSATQNAQNATKAAGDAETAANDAVHRADSLDSVVKGSGQLQVDGNVTVTFGFDKAVLTKDDKEQLDTFAAAAWVGEELHSRSYRRNRLDGLGRLQLRPEPAPRRRSGAVPGIEVRRCRTPLLPDRHRQGQGSCPQHHRGRSQAESPRGSPAA